MPGDEATIAKAIEAKGEEIRQLKGAKADKAALQPHIDALLALKKEYKEARGSDYKPPAAAAAAPAPAPAKKEKKAQEFAPQKEGPSKKELKKLEKKAKKQESKQANGLDVSGSASGAAGGAGAGATSASSGTPTLYPGQDSQSTQMVLAVAHTVGVKLQRGYGTKPSFFGSEGPHLELGNGQVVSGVEAAVLAVALVFGSSSSSLSASRPAVDDALEWGFHKLKPAVAHASEGEGGAQHLLKEMTVLESGLVKNEGGKSMVSGGVTTLADLVLAPLAKQALQFFGEHEYPTVRKWSGALLNGEAYLGTAALVSEGGAFENVDLAAGQPVDPRRGLFAVVRGLFTASLHKSYPDLALGGDPSFREADVAQCGNPAHGDYQCNSPMGIYKALKASGAPSAPARPQEVANTLIANLPPSALEEVIADVSVAGAGFINVRLKDSYLKARVRELLDHGGPQALPARKLKVAVDFSSPNIAKEMHVGHLRSTIIGDTLCRMLEFLGHDVLRINHVGDWGTQFGMLINYLKEEYPNFMSEPPNITDLTSFYKAAKNRFDESEEFKDRSRTGVVELQAGNPESRAIWKLLCDISRAEFQKVYDRLDVRLEEYGESFYNEMIPGAIDSLNAKGLLLQDNGATIMWCGGKHQIPLMVRKSDGGYGYDSTDLAAIRYRVEELKRDWVIYITDAGQSSHFYMIFDAARLVGWVDDNRHRLDHVGFGVVQGEDGKRFKTRSGDTVRLVDLLDEAVLRMTNSLTERIKDGKCSLTEEEAKEAASALGYGAVKYADLKQNPSTDYQFSYDRMLDTKGDTAIYLLFTCARFYSILKKAEEEKGINVKELVASGEVVLEHPTERALALELSQFAESLESAVLELMPNRICSYVFGLSTKATDFLEACHVLTTPHRLLLVQATAATISRCLELLGIKPLTKI